MFILRFDLESGYALGGDRPKRTGASGSTKPSPRSRRYAELSRDTRCRRRSSSWGLLLEKAGDRLASILKRSPLVEVQSHSYHHVCLKNDGPEAPDTLRRQLRTASDCIVKFFGEKPIGMCAPGNFHRGLQGRSDLLQVMSEEGYRFIGTDGAGPPEQPMPAPFTQPYWYADDGFPDLLEEPITGWHCNMLFNTGGQSDGFEPQVGFPDGTMLEKIPETVEEGFAARAREFQYAIDNELVYAPGNHPWSIYRFDPEMEHLTG